MRKTKSRATNVVPFPSDLVRPHDPAAVTVGQIVAVPPAKHRKIVAFIVGQMSKRRTVAGAEKELADHLWIEVGRLSSLGISDDEIDHFTREFAVAAWTSYFKDRETRGIA